MIAKQGGLDVDEVLGQFKLGTGEIVADQLWTMPLARAYIAGIKAGQVSPDFKIGSPEEEARLWEHILYHQARLAVSKENPRINLSPRQNPDFDTRL